MRRYFTVFWKNSRVEWTKLALKRSGWSRQDLTRNSERAAATEGSQRTSTEEFSDRKMGTGTDTFGIRNLAQISRFSRKALQSEQAGTEVKKVKWVTWVTWVRKSHRGLRA
jgi:hypothetical protein